MGNDGKFLEIPSYANAWIDPRVTPNTDGLELDARFERRRN